MNDSYDIRGACSWRDRILIVLMITILGPIAVLLLYAQMLFLTCQPCFFSQIHWLIAVMKSL